jgi:murein DD-endopeptidase MepM/ murein hydrolase activator NlpD
MKQRLVLLLQRLQVFLTSALTAETTNGSGLGIYLRTKIKRPNFRQLVGVNLAGLAFAAGFIVPQSSEAIQSLEVAIKTQRTVVVVEQSASFFQWPLRSFGMSQGFSVYHPGMDLTDPVGTPIYPIAEGVVTWTKYLPYGYGYHVLITHPDGLQSLYAHMNKIVVREGQGVTKITKLGEMGLTGWTTGSHLHFEIYQDNTPANPLEILPEIKVSES